MTGARRAVAMLALLAALTPTIGESAVGFGLEAGVAQAGDRNRDIRQYGLTAAWDLPYRHALGESWVAWTQITGRAGHMVGWGDGGHYAALGLGVNLTAIQAGVSLEGSAGPIAISRVRFGGADFGGHMQHLTQLGFSFQITPAVSLGYRFQHMSNGGLERSNPGLDSHLFRIEVRAGSAPSRGAPGREMRGREPGDRGAQ